MQFGTDNKQTKQTNKKPTNQKLLQQTVTPNTIALKLSIYFNKL
jgi:hypothetical protein